MGRVTKYMVLICALLYGFAYGVNAQTPAPVYDTIPMMHSIEFDRPLTFMDGPVENFSVWCSNNIDYPQEALRNNISGKVVVRFIITADGNVSDVRVVKSAHPLLDAEAVRVVSSSPAWETAILSQSCLRYWLAI